MHKTISAYSESEIGVNAQKLVHATQYHNSEAKKLISIWWFEEEKAEDICVSEATGERWSIY